MRPWKAIEELEKGAGRQFGPEVVKAFKIMLFHQRGTYQSLSDAKAFQV
jgi:HD-GYP domain-containing protein (c-di-GMP phosphodiesterase class II)